MQVTRDRVILLCSMAREGSRDEAGRQFAIGMLESFQQQWAEQDQEKLHLEQKVIEAKIASQVKEAEARVRQELEADSQKKELVKSNGAVKP